MIISHHPHLLQELSLSIMDHEKLYHSQLEHIKERLCEGNIS